MVRLNDLPEDDRRHMLAKPCPTFEGAPFVPGPPLSSRRVAIVTTAAVQMRDDPPFDFRTAEYRVIPGDVDGAELVMSHTSVNFDRTGFQHDVNVVFPIDRLRELVERGGVDEVVKVLENANLIYTGTLEPPKGKSPEDWEPRPQLLFKATEFGDDVDRPLKKSDGTWTYFATDMAYHLDKHRRGFADLIDVWGTDHGGYVKRMNAAVAALTGEADSLDVVLCQMVNLLDAGEPVKMSKRSGTFVTLAEVIDQVGKDVVRFIMLTRKNDAGLDFDLAKVVEQSRDNPVFYVQYSHARCCSVLRHAAAMFEPAELAPDSLQLADFGVLTDAAELNLIKTMAAWPRILEAAAEAHEPHRIAYFLHDLSGAFHALWTKGARQDESLRFLNESDKELTRARLALVKALAMVIASGLTVMGVTPAEEM